MRRAFEFIEPFEETEMSIIWLQFLVSMAPLKKNHLSRKIYRFAINLALQSDF